MIYFNCASINQYQFYSFLQIDKTPMFILLPLLSNDVNWVKLKLAIRAVKVAKIGVDQCWSN